MEIRPIPDCPKEHIGDRILVRCHAVKYVLCYCNSVKGVVQTAVFCFSLKCWTADVCSRGKIFQHLPVYEKVTFCLSSSIRCIPVCHICSWLRSRFRKSLQSVSQTCVGEQRSALFSLTITIPPSLCGIFLSLSLRLYYIHTPIKLSKVWVWDHFSFLPRFGNFMDFNSLSVKNVIANTTGFFIAS